MLQKTSIVVLHRFPYSDSSWVLKALSPEFGVLSFLVKGGKRSENSFKACLDPLSESDVVFSSSGKSELCFLREASLRDWHPALRNDLVSLAEAEASAEVLLRFAPQGMPLEAEFDILRETLQKLDENDQTALAVFLFRLSELWGFGMNVSECAVCGRPLSSPPADIREESGEALCEACAFGQPSGKKAAYFADLFRLANGLLPQEPGEVELGILRYLRLHLGVQQEVRSLAFLNEVRKLCVPQKKF